MKTSELMRGDWVCVYSNDRTEIHPFMVNEIVERGVYDAHKGFVEEKDIEPIPLTEEILEKNGFEKKVWWKYRESDVTTYAIGDGFHIELSENEFWLVDNCSEDGDYGYESNWFKDVKYVHKLQHLLKDLEIEKEIIL